MSDEHDYYSDQCANCRWAEWRGGCLNKKTNEDGLDLVAANKGECKLFEAGEPQKRRPQPGDRLSVALPLDDLSDLHARLDAAEAALAVMRAEVAQLQADRAFLLLLTVQMIGATAVPTEPDVVRRVYDVLKAQAPRAVPDVTVADHIRAMLEQVAAEAQPALGGQARQVDDNLESKQE